MGLNLIGKIELDGAGFERGLKRAGGHVTDFAKNAAVAAFGFYGVEEAIKKTVETATELVNTSKRLDVTVEQLQLLRQAAKQGGTELDVLAKGFEKIDIARSKALAGDKDAIAAFAKLGVTQAQLQTQTAATLFTGSISNAAKSNSVEDIGPALKEILGKGFGELIPVLKTDFDELGSKMKKLGTIMETEAAVKLKALGDEYSLISQILVSQLAPALIWTAETLYKAFAKLSGLAAAAGAGTSNFKFKDWSDVFMSGGLSLLFGKTFDKTAAKQAYEDTTSPLIKGLEEWQKKMAAEEEELKHPKPRSGEVETPAEKASKRLGNTPSDSLVKVGNFLGSNGNTIERVNQQKVELLRKIAANTEPKIGRPGGVGSFGYIAIPSV